MFIKSLPLMHSTDSTSSTHTGETDTRRRRDEDDTRAFVLPSTGEKKIKMTDRERERGGGVVAVEGVRDREK